MTAIRLHTSKGFVPEGFEGVHCAMGATCSKGTCKFSNIRLCLMGHHWLAGETSFAVNSGVACTRESYLAFHGCGVACIQRDALTSGI